LCGDPRIFVDLTKVPQVFRNPGGSLRYKTKTYRTIFSPLALARGFSG
jgi:hypothetical protein